MHVYVLNACSASVLKHLLQTFILSEIMKGRGVYTNGLKSCELKNRHGSLWIKINMLKDILPTYCMLYLFMHPV